MTAVTIDHRTDPTNWNIWHSFLGLVSWKLRVSVITGRMSLVLVAAGGNAVGYIRRWIGLYMFCEGVCEGH